PAVSAVAADSGVAGMPAVSAGAPVSGVAGAADSGVVLSGAAVSAVAGRAVSAVAALSGVAVAGAGTGRPHSAGQPSAAAVMTAAPAPWAVTTPFSTVATAGSLVCQVTAASCAGAVAAASVSVWPAVRLASGRESWMLSTGVPTVSRQTAVRLLPGSDTVISARPCASAVTLPASSTAATVSSLTV